MKLTITATYEAKRMTVKQLMNKNHGMFIERVTDEPASVDINRNWLSFSNPKQLVYHLTEMCETRALK